VRRSPLFLLITQRIRSIFDTETKRQRVLLEGSVMPMRLFQDQNALAGLCRRRHIRRLALFGSVLKGAARSGSDVDLLVEFEPGQEPGLLRLASIQSELSALLGGRPVDLRTAGDLSPYFRDEVVRTAEVQFESV
jgi:uncharacterized protein